MRRQLILAFLILILITLAGVGLIARSRAADQIHYFIGRGGALGLEALVQELETYYQENGWEGVEDVMNPSRQSGQGRGQSAAGGRNLQLADADGSLIYAPAAANIGTLLSEEDLAYSVELLVDGQTIGYLVSSESAAAPGADLDETLIQLIDQAILGAAAIAGAAALVLSIVLASALIRPLRHLTRASTRLARGELHQRVEETGPPEIRTLAQSFNNMAASLERLESNRRAMTADIAHELRTPLSVQRVNLEAMLDGVYPLDQANLATIAAQNDLLTRLVEDLRILSLADAGELILNKEEVELASLTARIHEQFLADASELGISLSLDTPTEPVVLHLDPLRISQILNNLLQNALRHTPANGSIAIRLRREKNAIRLAIQDSGPGIPDEVLPHIFERFYRVESNHERQKDGTGLGLAIARKLAEAHGGTLYGDNASGHGAVFTLQLPLV